MQIELHPQIIPTLETRSKETGETFDELINEILFSFFSSDEYVIELIEERFRKIPSVRKAFLSPTNSIIVIQDENNDDRPKIYDVEQLLQIKIPSRYFSFFTATNEADYSTYKKIYERRQND